jgi:hypothetical protein
LRFKIPRYGRSSSCYFRIRGFEAKNIYHDVSGDLGDFGYPGDMLHNGKRRDLSGDLGDFGYPGDMLDNGKRRDLSGDLGDFGT